MHLGVAAILLAGVTLVCAGEDIKGWVVPEDAKAVKNPLAATPDVLAAGAALYVDKCANCHGDKGKGDGPEAEMYDTPPSDLTRPGRFDNTTDGEIFWKITKGRRPMPGFAKQLSDDQRWQLVHYVRKIVAQPVPRPAAAKPAKPTPDQNAAPKKP
jgi:mono/diheme cytochrome c family protein